MMKETREKNGEYGNIKTTKAEDYGELKIYMESIKHFNGYSYDREVSHVNATMEMIRIIREELNTIEGFMIAHKKRLDEEDNY